MVLYRQRRRLLPFIALHALWDSSSFAAEYLPNGALSALPFLLLGSAFVILRVTAPRQAPGRTAQQLTTTQHQRDPAN